MVEMKSDIEEIVRRDYPLRIRQGALSDAYAYARNAWIDGERVEAYMHMIGDDTIEEIILNPAQKVTTNTCVPTIFGRNQVSQMKKNIIGWCHSHGDLDIFFSYFDRSTAKKGPGGI